MLSYTIDKFRIDIEVIKATNDIPDSVSYQFFYPDDNSVPLATADVLERDIRKE
jgi:hypothetical protein